MELGENPWDVDSEASPGSGKLVFSPQFDVNVAVLGFYEGPVGEEKPLLSRKNLQIRRGAHDLSAHGVVLFLDAYNG